MGSFGVLFHRWLKETHGRGYRSPSYRMLLGPLPPPLELRRPAWDEAGPSLERSWVFSSVIGLLKYHPWRHPRLGIFPAKSTSSW